MLKNIMSLYAIQMMNFVIPLVVTPYLARVLGVQAFGAVGVCGSIVAYLSLIANWGFDLSATQQVAQANGDPEALRRIFWDTLFSKMSLGLICCLLMVLGWEVSPAVRAFGWTYPASALALLANAFGVNWFLQGLERMGRFAAASLIGRMMSIPLTLLLVHGPQDSAWAALIQGMTLMTSAIASLLYASRSTPLRPVNASARGMLLQLQSGFHLFVSMGAVSLYTYANVVAVGLMAGQTQAGFFDGADRLRRAGQSMTIPIGNAMYPRLNAMMVSARDKVLSSMMRLLAVQCALTFAITALLIVTAPWATVLFLGKAYAASVPLVQVLALNVFFIGVSNVLGVNIMLPMGMKQTFTNVLLLSGVVNIGLLILMVPGQGAMGAAISVTITEALVTVLMAGWLWINRHRLHPPVSQIGESAI